MSNTADDAYRKHLTAALSRDNRVPAVLHPAAVQVDERTLRDDLVFAGALSNYLNFYTTDNQINGTWHTFFGRSEPVLLAGIAGTRLNDVNNQFNKLLEQFQRTDRLSEKVSGLKAIYKYSLMLALRINHWYVHLSHGDHGSVQKEFENQISGRICGSLRQLRYIGEKVVESQLVDLQLDVAFNRFGSKWQLSKEFVPPPDFLALASGDPFQLLLQAIRKIYNDFYQSLSYLVEYTRRNLDSILRENSSNRPDMSLFLAFLKLLEKSREQLNSLTARHLDYYYKDVLRQQQQPFKPDQTFVTFRLLETEPVYLLPAGSLVQAGKDKSGNQLTYTTDKTIFINQAQVAALHTLFVSRNPEVITFVDDRRVPMIKTIYRSTDPSRKNNEDQMEWWSPVGIEQHELSIAEGTMEQAEIGFSVASAVLFLAEGRRDIKLTFSVDASSKSAIQLHTIIREAMRNQQRNQDGAEFYLMHKAFRVSLTTASGWLDVNRYAFSFDQERNELVLRFVLGPNEPAIGAVDAEKHGDVYKPGLPVLRLLLNTKDAPVYAFSLLSGLPVNRIQIDTVVTGIRRLTLFNNAGQLSPDKPFQPFGPQATVGSYLLIGCEEAFNKHLSSLSVRMRWHDLPPDGLRVQYNGYPGAITNESFQVGVSLLQDGYFLPPHNDQQVVPLFENAPCDHPERSSPVKPETIINTIDLLRLGQRANWEAPEPQSFVTDTQDGFLRLELCTPATGFGTTDYPMLLSETIMRNGRQKKQEPLPLAPYIPQISTISLDYSASFDSDNTNGDQDEPRLQLYRHFPFGTELTKTGPRLYGAPLLPELDQEGYLYIGLSGLVPPQPLTLLIQVSEESLHPEEAPSPVSWFYLSNNAWKKLSAERVLTDGTQNFITPGIVELDLPSDITTGNTIMPAEFHWICAAIPDRTQYTNFVKAISTQAVSATWLNTNNDLSHLDAPLPAGSINRLEPHPAAIREVLQPMASRNGQPPEQPADLYVRVSERLSHRNRALLPLDYERLVLQAFPDVYMVKCFPNLSASGNYKPGEVMLVVIPDIDRRDDVNIYRPKDCYAHLQQITQFVQQRCPPHVKVFVRNPLYERVKVVARIRLRAGLDTGFYLRRLNDDMRKFLSPWLYDDQSEPLLGGEVSRSDVAGFLERQSYIDFVTALSVVVTRDDNGHYQLVDTARNGDDVDCITSRQPWSIMVTASRHQFTLLPTDSAAGDGDNPLPPEKRGINNLILSNDFIIAADHE